MCSYCKKLFDENKDVHKQMRIGSSDNGLSDRQLSDAFNAMIGATFLLYGFATCWTLLHYYDLVDEKMKKSIKKPCIHAHNSILGFHYADSNDKILTEAEKILKYDFNNKSLLKEALTQRSYEQICPGVKNYEQLEFLGDAVIEALIFGTYLRKYFATIQCDKDFSQVSNFKEKGVCGNLQKFILTQKGLHKLIFHNCVSTKMNIISYENEVLNYTSKYGIKAYGEFPKMKPKTYKTFSDVFEAIIGAVYLDTGPSLEKTWAVYSNLTLEYLKEYAYFEPYFNMGCEVKENEFDDFLQAFSPKLYQHNEKIVTQPIEIDFSELSCSDEFLKLPAKPISFESSAPKPLQKLMSSTINNDFPELPSKPNISVTSIAPSGSSIRKISKTDKIIVTLSSSLSLFYQAFHKNKDGNDELILEQKVNKFTQDGKIQFSKLANKEMNKKHPEFGGNSKPRIIETKKK